jgi:hypothetical protein
VEWGEAGGTETAHGKKEVRNEFPESMDVDMRVGKETLMVNAAIMDGKNKPTNAPWIVDLELPMSGDV